MTQKYSTQMSRRAFIGASGLFALSSLAVGCSSDKSGAGTGAAKAKGIKLPTYVEPKAVEGIIDGEGIGAPFYLGTPPSAYKAVESKPLNGEEISSFQILWGTPPIGRGENQVWAALEENLGASKFDITMVPSASYSQKLATTLASGQLPDFIYLPNDDPNGVRAINDGAFAPLNDFLEGDKVKEWNGIASTPEEAWQDSLHEGQIIGIPQPSAKINDFPVMRKDAMKQIGVDKIPDNGKDFKDLLLELAKVKKIGDREVWVWGALGPDNFEPIYDLGQEFQLVDGKVTSKFHLDAYEEFLNYMTELWKGGVFHPDAIGKVTPELFKQGQQLAYRASFAGFYWIPDKGRANLVKQAAPTAELEHFAFPSINGGPGKVPLLLGYNGMVCIPRDRAKDPERVKRLLAVLDFYRSPIGSEEAMLVKYGLKGRSYDLDADQQLIPIKHEGPGEGAVTWIGVQSNPVFLMPKINEDKLENVKDTMKKMVENGADPELQRLPNEPLVKSRQKLNSLVTDYFNGIVSGRRPVSDLEEMRSQYLKAGGQAAIDEYEKQLEATKK